MHRYLSSLAVPSPPTRHDIPYPVPLPQRQDTHFDPLSAMSTIHKRQYVTHVAEFSRVVAVFSHSYRATDALGRLRGDGLAQMMSYVPGNGPSLVFAAVCPQTRLDREAITFREYLTDDNSPDDSVDSREEVLENRACVMEGRLCFQLNTLSDSGNTESLWRVLWWMSWCLLPLHLTLHNDDEATLAALDDCVRTRTFEVAVYPHSATAECKAGAKEVACDGHCGALLCALPAFSVLQRFGLRVSVADGEPSAAVRVVPALLRAVADTPADDVWLYGCDFLSDLCALTANTRGRRLTVRSSGIRSLRGVACLPLLTRLEISRCPLLTGLRKLAGAQCLQHLTVQRSGLLSVDGLSACPALKTVDLAFNRALQSLTGLSGAPSLEIVYAIYCEIREMGELNRCPQLMKIDVSRCFHLTRLCGLAGASRLRSFTADACDLRDLDDLKSCAALKTVCVYYNHALGDTTGYHFHVWR